MREWEDLERDRGCVSLVGRRVGRRETWQKGICRLGVSSFLRFAEEGGRVRGFFPRAWPIHFRRHSVLGLLTLLVNSKKRIGCSLSMWIAPMRIPILVWCTCLTYHLVLLRALPPLTHSRAWLALLISVQGLQIESILRVVAGV
jgi:hypothetical protein